MKDPTITFRVSQELYDKAKAKAKHEDITMSQVLRRYLRQWVAEDEQPEEETTEQD
jgi:antitoxin component of RelBE/YafQ-DinJ toxin-antitoxin module